MVNQRNRFPARRRFLKQSAALSAGAALPASVVFVQSAAAKAPDATEPAPRAPDARARKRAAGSRP